MTITVNNMPLRAAFRILVFGTMLSCSAAIGYSQAKDVKVGQVGPFTIHSISEKGKFNRCAATMDPGPKMLRIAWNREHIYTVSVPTAPKDPKKPYTMTINFGKNGFYKAEAKADGNRSWVAVDIKSVEQLMKVRNQFVVDLGPAHYVWNIGNVPMEDVLAKVEDCVFKAAGR